MTAATVENRSVEIEKRNLGGRPRSFRPEFVEQTRKLARLAATEAEIAHLLGVSKMTLWRWRSDYPEFAEALRVGREAATERVENSLFHRAVGYTYDSEKIVVVDKKVERVPIKEHVPPDVPAQQFWLTNRAKHDWRNRQEVEVGAPGDFDRLSDDELRRFITAEAAQVVSPAKLEAPKKATGIAAAPRGRKAKSDLFG